jgi:hypothetical protein
MSRLREAFKETNEAALGAVKPISIAFCIIVAMVLYVIGLVKFVLIYDLSLGWQLITVYSILLSHGAIIAYGVTLYKKFKGK